MSDHFSIAEMTESSAAVRLGIDNTPDLATIARLGATVSALERVRSLLGLPVHVNSGFRCEALERALCDADYRTWCERNGDTVGDTSWARYFGKKSHARGYAADFTCAQFGTPAEIVAVIAASDIPFDQCIEEGAWVHISFDPRMRGEVMTKRFDRRGVSTMTVPVQRQQWRTTRG